jgi:hypothetical protein
VGEGRTQRYTVTQAADILGISPGAVRNRLSRGTLARVKEGGDVYVLLPADMSRPTTDIPGSVSPSDSDALTSEIEALRDQVQWLRGEVQRKDAVLLSMTEAMKALSPPPQEAPPEARESPQTGRDAAVVGETTEAPAEAQEGVAKLRPWWRRWFGG